MAESEGGGDSGGAAGSRSEERFVNDKSDDAGGGGTEGDTDTDLAGALGGAVRNYPVDARNAEKKADGGEGSEEVGSGPLVSHGVGARLV